MTVTPYVPDIHHFSGRGGKDVLPMYRDQLGRDPNLPAGLLGTLRQVVGQHLTVDDVVAYIHGLLGTSAFSERFAHELSEIAEPVHIPMTSNSAMFNRAVELGRELLWYHTWGERYRPTGSTTVPLRNTGLLSPIHGYPETYRYQPDEQILEVGTGRFSRVTEDVWSFEVSGLAVLDSWLGSRMANRRGKPSGPLSDIRPRRWVFTDELLLLITILQRTIDLTPIAAEILDDIIAGPLIPTMDIPRPTAIERGAPRT